MWNRIKRFWNWVLIKVGYRKALIIKRSWPYEDYTTRNKDIDGTNLIYLHSHTHLESKLSRKFKTNDHD